MPKENGKLIILTNRAGTVQETIEFLNDLELAYNALYFFDTNLLNFDNLRYRPIPYFYIPIGTLSKDKLRDFVLPEDYLTINKISIQSPGLWEFLGSLNPLEQLRKYLNDRHERRKDKEWREKTDREKSILENQLIQNQVLEGNNRIVKERIEIFRELGYSKRQIRSLIWQTFGKPLKELGKHQDSGIIEKVE